MTTEQTESVMLTPTPEQVPEWMDGLTYKDWLFDGSPIRGNDAMNRFDNLDWSKAWVDLGPSIAGNLGPYWHVPMDDGDTTHRLYPKVLTGKWLLVIRQACKELIERLGSERLMEENDKLRIELASAKMRIAELERPSKD